MEFRYAKQEKQTLKGEEWRPMIHPTSGVSIPGRLVSSQGRVKLKNGRISKGHQRKDLYYVTTICLDSHSYTFLVHRLVARAFLDQPPTPEHTEVNHKDLDKGNNAVKNLEYVTPAENIAHCIANMKGPHPLSRPILSRLYGSSDEWRFHPSSKSAALDLGLDQSHVCKCVAGKQRQTGGYEFCLVEPEEALVATLPHEEWRDVDLDWHLRDREVRRKAS